MSDAIAELRRHAGLLPALWRYSVRRELEFRTNFVLYSGTYLLFSAFSLVMTALLFAYVPRIGGWELADAWLVMATALFVHAALNALFSRNVAALVAAIPRGELDFVLLKPVSAQFYVSLRLLALHQVPAGAFALAAVGWGCLRLPSPPSPGEVALYGLLLACALAICYSAWFMLATVALRVERATNIHELMDVTLQFSRFPTDVLVPPLRYAFTVVVPVAFVATIPAKALLGTISPIETAAALVLAPASLVVSHEFWRKSLKRYVSASS